MQPDLSGQQIGPYQIHHRLGEGGMSTVYRATHAVMGWDVALKVLNPSLTGDRDFVERFTREARLLDQMRHPNIVQVKDVAWQNGGRSLSMSEIQTRTRPRTPIPPKRHAANATPGRHQVNPAGWVQTIAALAALAIVAMVMGLSMPQPSPTSAPSQWVMTLTPLHFTPPSFTVTPSKLPTLTPVVSR